MKPYLKAAALAVALIGGQALAEAPKPFPEFSAKRVKPPGKRAGKRITVQIAPAAPASPAAPAAKPGATPARAATPGSYLWFWETVSTGMDNPGPGRAEAALAHLRKRPGGQAVPAPRLQALSEIARAQGVEILKSTIGTQVSPALVLAVIAVESGGRADAVSKAGAEGLMQLMPATAERFGVTDAKLASQNIAGGVRYLDWLLRKFDGDPILALAGYNAGENSVTRHNGVPPFAETRDYVPKVLAAYNVARGLCRTPPQFMSDGCVFATSK